MPYLLHYSIRKIPHKIITFLCLFIIAVAATAVEKKPNIIVILTDDLGYGDISCYGATDIATPNIDRMATEGINCTSFYVAPVCSPTRAAFMTGSFGKRVGIGGVLFPRNNSGINPTENTVAELLKSQGYVTAIIGKWHLGNEDMFQPMNHGFDTWYGTPASNSQGYHPTLKQFADNCVFRDGFTRDSILKMEEAPCPLVRDNVVIEVPADQTLFTQRYTHEAISFITKNKDKPFFLYVPHNIPHIPIHASKEFIGTSKRGIYGDAVQELDWSTGEILKTIKELGIDDNTLVIFTSDNGPNLSKNGRALPLRGGKGTTLEGGVRVPFIARWPSKIPAHIRTDQPITIMDLLPTFVGLAGGQVPSDPMIDGKNIWPFLAGIPNATSPHEAIFYISGSHVTGIRMGDWKYTTAQEKAPKEKGNKKDKTAAKEPDEVKKKATSEGLYNLRDDIGEAHNVYDDHPDIVQKLKQQLNAFEKNFSETQRSPGVAEQ